MYNAENLYKVQLPNQLGKLPDDIGGIYIFMFRFPSDYELGIIDGDVNFAKLNTLMQIYIENFVRLSKRGNFKGKLYNSVAEHLQINYNFAEIDEISIDYENLLKAIFKDIDNRDLVQLINLMRNSFLFTNPAYVGMARRQSLRKRIEQHINYQTDFASKIKSLNMSWSEFNCYAFPLHINRSKTRNFEKLIQFITKPVHCKY